MRSTAEVLEGNKVRLTIEVDEDELRSAVDDTMRKLEREVVVPGFRPGKVPRRLLEVRLGGKAIREEVLRHAVPDYYAQAVEDADLDIIAAPEIDITAGEEEGPLAFAAIVEVRPKVGIPGYDGLRVTISSPEPTDVEVDAQVNRLREQFAELKDVERPVRDGDLVTLDITGVRGEEVIDALSSSDLVYEVGTGGLLEGADAKLHSAKPGDIVEVDAEDAPGGPAKVRMLVKAVREKVLPEPTDNWAQDASEFDTVEQLRADIRSRLTGLKRLQANLELREKAVEAVAALVVEDMPEILVREEAQRLEHGLVHRLNDSRVTLEEYLAARGKMVDELVEELNEQAAVQVRSDLALRALADMEDLQASDDELASEIGRLAAEANRPVREVARQIAEGAGLERLRSEIRNSKAVAWLVEHVEIVDEQGKPMDRALLFEQEKPEQESSGGDGSPEAALDSGSDLNRTGAAGDTARAAQDLASGPDDVADTADSSGTDAPKAGAAMSEASKTAEAKKAAPPAEEPSEGGEESQE